VGADPEILTEVPFFALLDEQERSALAERVDTVSKPAGTTLFNYGDPGDSLYIVRAGEVEIFFKNDTGERIVLETAVKGDFFGEISLLDGGARTASARVTKDLEAVVVDRGDLESFLRARPAAAMELLTAAGRRLRESAKLLRRTASRNVNEETENCPHTTHSGRTGARPELAPSRATRGSQPSPTISPAPPCTRTTCSSPGRTESPQMRFASASRCRSSIR